MDMIRKFAKTPGLVMIKLFDAQNRNKWQVCLNLVEMEALMGAWLHISPQADSTLLSVLQEGSRTCSL